MADRRRLDAGERADPVQQFLGEAVALVERRVLGRRQRYAHEQHAIGGDAGVHVLQHEERAHGQARADEQHDRQRDLNHHQQVARAAALRSGYRYCGPALSASVMSDLDVCSAGTRPNTIPVSTETARENASTGRLTATRDSLGT